MKKQLMMISGIAILIIAALWQAAPRWAQAQLSPRLVCDSASPGDVVYIQGENFTPGAEVESLTWDGVAVPWGPTGLTAAGDGSFTLRLTAPSDTYQLHTLVASDSAGEQGECYLNLLPRYPSPTPSATPTLTPTPTPTFTPGPPPGVTLTPTPTPGPNDYCAAMSAAFTRNPVAGTSVQAGLDVANLGRSWGSGQFQAGLWKHYGGIEADTGVRAALPALESGGATTLSFSFQENDAGPVWYQLRLVEVVSGAVASGCVSEWHTLYVRGAEPDSPPLSSPGGQSWLNEQTLRLDWLAATVPDTTRPIEEYQVQLRDSNGALLLDQSTVANVTEAGYTLPADAAGLTWQARARNAAGWGDWSDTFQFGVDTTAPAVSLAVQGTTGDNGWYISPVQIRVTGSDPAPASGLSGAYLQAGDAPWQSVHLDVPYLLEREGEATLRAYGQDMALNRSEVAASPVKLDLTPPEQVTANLSGNLTSSGWYTGPVTINVSAVDLVSGVANRWVDIDGGGRQTAPATLSENGEHTIRAMSRDAAGHESTSAEVSVKLDLTPPTGELVMTGNLCQQCTPLNVSVAPADGESGVGHWTLSIFEPGSIEETIIASGRSADTVELRGSDFPTGTLTLALAVEDEAGQTFTRSVDVLNGGASPYPTPTPFPGTQSTPLPTPAAGATATPGATATASATPTPGDNDDDDDDDDISPSPAPANYPVGSQMVPALLPVTGEDVAGSPLLSGRSFGFYSVAIGGGILLSTFLGMAIRFKSRRKEAMASPRADQLLARYRNATNQARQMINRN